MDENLVGYLLNALEPDEHRALEQRLRTDPEVRRRLDLLRKGLEPLAADVEAPEPPSGLWVRALGRIAEHQCRSLPIAPRARPTPTAPSRFRWRRADVLVAASILLCVGLLGGSGLLQLQRYREDTGCVNNLREIGKGALQYANLRGSFPNVAQHDTPRNVAGMFIPELIHQGDLPAGTNIRCPANGAPVSSPWTLAQLNAMPPEEFRRNASSIGGCYAYNVGYQNGDRIFSHRRGDSDVPLVADAPPENPATNAENSTNHQGRGQNVLFGDGRVEFHTKRSVNKDEDIFLNQARQVAPGLHRGDIVLGTSATPVSLPR